ITTLDNSKTQLRMTDGTMIALKTHSELQIDTGDGYSNVISMTLFKGSLRTVPGSIDTTNGHYRLKTPVGKVISTSAHFEVDIIDDAVYLSVWTGSLDFIATVGKPAVNIRLGEGQRHSQAKINAKGQLTLLNKGR
ncbi:MAG: FecR family protein, partial [Psychrosphaera sp.]|nr:FecR family protein [Psychrosphaera sp.]